MTALCFFFQAEDGIRDSSVTGVQTCALPISGSFPRGGQPLAATFRRLANCGDEHRPSGPLDGLHRRHAAVAFDTAAPGIDRNLQCAQATRSLDPRTVERTRGLGVALENSRPGPGTAKPEPARASLARADESNSERARRIRRFHAGDR